MNEALTTDQNIHRTRLLNVAKALRESPKPEKFDMSDVIHSCGTPACAFGHYAWRTDLQQEFAPKLIGDMWWDVVFTSNGEHCKYYGPEVREHFGLNHEELDELFEETGCGGAKTSVEAAEYIEAFIARKYPVAV